jgi:multicomponent Na+:H+ antiporter subunit F
MTHDAEIRAILAFTASLLLTAMVLAGIRIVRGPTAADRVVALDMLCLLGTAAAGVAALVSDAIAFVDIALAVALIGFLATVAFASFIERGSIQEEDRP